jgi:hypothetical protein
LPNCEALRVRDQLTSLTNVSVFITGNNEVLSCDPGALTPSAPAAGAFMWQSLQTHFQRGGAACTGRTVAAMGDQAFCYLAADNQLKCAGRVYSRTFGSNFVPIGQSSVDQVLLSSTSNSEIGNAMCVHKLDGTAWCMGAPLPSGQFGVGNTNPQPDFVRWGAYTDLMAIATGTWDQLCALRQSGEAVCAGFSFGLTPTRVGTATGPGSLWVDTSGSPHIDDPSVFRAANARTECTVQSAGLSCGRDLFGSPGAVVDGTSGSRGSTCWLSSSGTVQCRLRRGDVRERFHSGRVLLLAANYYTDSLCAIYNDGSVWCVGDNWQGKLGTGTADSLLVETMVQPPGSALINCSAAPSSEGNPSVPVLANMQRLALGLLLGSVGALGLARREGASKRRRASKLVSGNALLDRKAGV